MNNLVYLIGRLTDNPEIKELPDEKTIVTINVAVQRNYKNEDGTYETDFIPCIMWKGITSNICDYCKKGDLIGIKGKIETRKFECEDGTNKYFIELIAEKVTFLNSKKDT